MQSCLPKKKNNGRCQEIRSWHMQSDLTSKAMARTTNIPDNDLDPCKSRPSFLILGMEEMIWN